MSQTQTLQLTEDIQALKWILQLLDGIDVSNVTDDREFGWQMFKATRGQIESWLRYCEARMKDTYLKW